MTFPSPAEIAISFCRSLAAAMRHDEPYPHFCADDLFQREVVDALAELPFAQPLRTDAAGRREDYAARIFFDAESMSLFPVMQAAAAALQSDMVIKQIGRLCAAPLVGCYLRLEYAIDSDGFWLAPHTDIGVKKFTCLISLANDSNQSNYGTDIYKPDKTIYKRAPFRRNGALMFVPSHESWHGFAARPIAGQRRSLILNYVGPGWRARDQLAFPDAPVGLAGD